MSQEVFLKEIHRRHKAVYESDIIQELADLKFDYLFGKANGKPDENLLRKLETRLSETRGELLEYRWKPSQKRQEALDDLSEWVECMRNPDKIISRRDRKQF